MKIMFDIGCNDGKSSEYYVNNNFQVFAFEPTPKLCENLIQKYINCPNFILIQKAIHIKEGISPFNVSGVADWGCSSLLDFIPDTSIYWGTRGDFKVTEVINVNTIRLDSFIRMLDIKRIDYFHCDTQGVDLSVLESLGKYISLIEEGQVEVANTRDVLYNMSNNYIEDVIEFLNKHNFKIRNITSNDGSNNESNLFFYK